jgi:serine/threonine-protein kinase
MSHLIRILPESFAGDPERLARFRREAEISASLNHPNIAAMVALAVLHLMLFVRLRRV